MQQPQSSSRYRSNYRGGARASASRGQGRGPGDSKGRGGGGGGPGRTGRLKGLFDRIWYCDCTPRLPAERFCVKKESPNKGRYFYTCQQTDKCGFFLWAEEAQVREASCVLSNAGKETPRNDEAQEGWSAGGPSRSVRFASPTLSPTPAARTVGLQHAAGVKRSSHDAGFVEDGNDDDYDDESWTLTSKEEEELARVADESIFQTPQKPRTSMGVYATPSSEHQSGKQTRSPRRLPWLEDPATPVSLKKSIGDYFATSPSKHKPAAAAAVEKEETPPPPPTHLAPTSAASAASVASAAAAEETTTTTPPPRPKQKQVLPEIPEPPSSPSPPTRFKDSLATSTENTLTQDVFGVLRSIPLPLSVKGRLGAILTKHDLRTEGVKMGRDISRAVLKTKEARIVELEERIRILERKEGKEERGGGDGDGDGGSLRESSTMLQQREGEKEGRVDDDDGEETDMEL